MHLSSSSGLSPVARTLARFPVLLAAVVALVLSVPSARADFFTSPGAAKRGIEAAIKKSGAARLLEVDILPSTMTVRTQGREKAHHIDEWTVSIRAFSRVGASVSGPRPGRGSTYVDDIVSGFFDTSEVSFDRLDEMIKAAAKHVALEDPGKVTRVRLGRRILTSPRAAYGDVRWTIEVNSRSESASVFFSSQGALQSADLSSTLRAKRLDLFRDHDVLPAATAQIAEVLGDKVVLRDISFTRTYIYIRADSPTDPRSETSYSWNLNGMRGGTDRSPGVFRSDEKRKFAFSEIDLSVLGSLKAAAFKALSMEGGSVTRMKAEKSAETFGPARVLWEIEITSKEGAQGRVIADAKGDILKVLPPAERRGAVVWLEPQAIRATLTRVAKEIGETTRMHELLINDSGASLTVEDPAKPGALVNLVVDEESIRRFGKPLFEKKVNPQRSFTIADLATLDVPAIEALVQRTLERLDVKGAKLARITLMRGDVFASSPEGKVTVELRTVNEDGDSAGRVVYAIDGKELDKVGP